MHPLVDYFRCPEEFAVTATAEPLPSDLGYFRLGDAVLYGRQSMGAPSARPNGQLPDVARGVSLSNGAILLPFDLGGVVEALRYERYPEALASAERALGSSWARSVYYSLRPALPVAVRKHLQKLSVRGWEDIPFPAWPVDTTVDELMRRVLCIVLERSGARAIPFIWFWPHGAAGCAQMTHDVEGSGAAPSCDWLMDVDTNFGISSSFQIIPTGRRMPGDSARRLVEHVQGRGFEVNVHDFNHDGHLFRSREIFERRAVEINAYGRQFGAHGFRSGAVYRRQAWIEELEFSYDMSVPNVSHLDGQQGGCCTVMPFFMGPVLELPLTTTQDYTLFHFLGSYSMHLWREQTERVLGYNGLASFGAHPDYLVGERERNVYVDLARYLADLRERRGVWTPRPSEINTWWRERREMRLVPDGDAWKIEGKGSERARLAWARMENDQPVYSVTPGGQA